MSRRGAWTEFLQSYCDCELEEVLLAPRDPPQHTLLIDGSLLLDYDLQLCSALLFDPRTELAALNRSAVEAQHQLLSTYQEQSRPHLTSLSVKENVHVRLHNLPHIPELVRNRVPASADMGKYLIVNGTVIRTGSTKVLERVQIWRCGTCQGITETEGLFELRYKLISPKKCSVETCRGYKFKHMQEENMKCTDYQEIKIQEKVERLDMGTIPRSMTVVLEYDLVDMCKAGDDVTIYGIVSQLWDQPISDTRCALETVLHANYIQIHNEQRCNLDVTDNAISRHYAHWRRYRDRPMSGRNLILASFCPEVYQLYIVKLAALLVMLGGVTHKDGRGSKVRGECHLLMVGDPGTGKSQILKYVSKLSPRSVITTGIGCTKAGLTVAAVKEGGEWALEAGAMVLADGGVCCVDELSSIRETDRVAIHEAMEQQTISVAKAGLVCKLNTRTTVLAATNPRGTYDITQPISANVPIGTPLLSRFDLILVLFDDHTPTWDSLVAGFLLKEQAVLEENNILKNYTADTLWSFEELQQYVCHVKSLTPKLTKPAKEVLGRYYRLQREQITRNVSRTTIRMLESLVRLSQAHAKLMMHEAVVLEDAIVTISLVECTMLNSSLLGSVSVLHSVFPAHPQLEFDKQKSMVLEVLGLPPNFGESDAIDPQPPRAPKPIRVTNMAREIDDLLELEVPSFHVDTQELRKEMQLQEKRNKAPLDHQSLVPEENSQPSQCTTVSTEAGGPKPCLVSKSSRDAVTRDAVTRDAVTRDAVTRDNEGTPRDISAASSESVSPTLKKTSFAELVRDFKARKRAKVTAPVLQQPEYGLGARIDDMLNQDFSDIMSTGIESWSSTASTAVSSMLQVQSDSTADRMSQRHNTPVTRMFDKFKSLPTCGTDDHVTQHVMDHVTSEESDHVTMHDARESRVPTFTPLINTQSVGLMSSAKENFRPPAPHFNISPVAKVTAPGPRDVTPPCDNVTPHELAAKTTRTPATSIFHNTSAEKLKKFAYQPRNG